MFAAEFIGWLVETERNECSRAQIVRDDEGRLINDSLACDRRGRSASPLLESKLPRPERAFHLLARTANGPLPPFATACSRSSYVLTALRALFGVPCAFR